MRGKYDFSQSDKNPYVKRLKQQITMLMDKEVVEYFKQLAAKTGIAYQVFIFDLAICIIGTCGI